MCGHPQAAGNGHVECCHLLLTDCKANVNFVGTFGVTALNMATINGHKAVIRLLLKHGAVETPIAGGGIMATASDVINLAMRIEPTPGINDLAEFMNRKHCAQCNKLADTKVCSRCKTVRYCCRECQKRHWTKHKPDCKTAH